SGLRVFGLGDGVAPWTVRRLSVTRDEDRRGATVTWDTQESAQGYKVRWGIAPDKLYSSWMVYEKGELELKGLTAGQPYYVAIEAFNENGVSELSDIIAMD